MWAGFCGLSFILSMYYKSKERLKFSEVKTLSRWLIVLNLKLFYKTSVFCLLSLSLLTPYYVYLQVDIFSYGHHSLGFSTFSFWVINFFLGVLLIFYWHGVLLFIFNKMLKIQSFSFKKEGQGEIIGYIIMMFCLSMLLRL